MSDIRERLADTVIAVAANVLPFPMYRHEALEMVDAVLARIDAQGLAIVPKAVADAGRDAEMKRMSIEAQNQEYERLKAAEESHG